MSSGPPVQGRTCFELRDAHVSNTEESTLSGLGTSASRNQTPFPEVVHRFPKTDHVSRSTTSVYIFFEAHTPTPLFPLFRWKRAVGGQQIGGYRFENEIRLAEYPLRRFRLLTRHGKS